MVILISRKPLIGTVVGNVLKYDSGGLNIDGCRVPIDGQDVESIQEAVLRYNGKKSIGGNGKYGGGRDIKREEYDARKGRWPANVMLEDCDEIKEKFPVTSEGRYPGKQVTVSWKMSSKGKSLAPEHNMGDSGLAARFFKQFKGNDE